MHFKCWPLDVFRAPEEKSIHLLPQLSAPSHGAHRSRLVSCSAPKPDFLSFPLILLPSPQLHHRAVRRLWSTGFSSFPANAQDSWQLKQQTRGLHAGKGPYTCHSFVHPCTRPVSQAASMGPAMLAGAVGDSRKCRVSSALLVFTKWLQLCGT